jgi:hypothetical protein
MIADCSCGDSGYWERSRPDGGTTEWPCPDCQERTCAICDKWRTDRQGWPSIEDRRDDALEADELAEDEARWHPILGIHHEQARVCDECWLGVP